MLVRRISSKGFLSRVYIDNFYKSVRKRQDDPMRKMSIKPKYFTKSFSIWPITWKKIVNLTSHQTNAIITPMWSHSKFTKMIKTKKVDNTTCYWGDKGFVTVWHFSGCISCNSWRTGGIGSSWMYTNTVTSKFPCSVYTYTRNAYVCSRKDVYKNAHSSTVGNSQKLKITPLPINSKLIVEYL